MPTRTPTYSDLDYLTAILMGESGAKDTPQSMGAIADVVMNRLEGANRAASEYGSSPYGSNTLAGIITASTGKGAPQFSSTTAAQAQAEGSGAAFQNYNNALTRGATAFSGSGLDRYNQARDVARSFLDSSRADYNRYRGSSGGSDFFIATGFPGWARNTSMNGGYNSQTVGATDFFRDRQQENGGAFIPYSDPGANANIANIPNPPSRPSGDDLGAYAGLINNLPPTRPSDAALSAYANSIDQGGVLDRFSDGLTGSLQDAGYQIADQFASVFGRLPTLNELQGRIGDLAAGGSTLYGQLRDIAGSQEASNYGQRIGVSPTAYTPQGEAPAFTSQGFGFFNNPYASVNDFIGNHTGDGGLQNGSFASGSAFQPGNLVNAAYHEWLNRDPTAEENAAWSDRIGQPGTNLSSVLAQIAGSQEAGNLRTSLMGSDASTGGAASYEPYLSRTSWGTDASTAAGVPSYTPNTGTAVGTDASRGGSYSYDPYLGYTSRGSDASTGGAGSYDPVLGHTSFGSDASTSGSVPGYSPNSGLAYGTDASRGGASSYDPLLGRTSQGTDASTGGAASYGGFLDPYGFSGAQVGTAGGIGNPTPDALGFNGGTIANNFNPSLPAFSPLPEVNTSGLGMNGARDSSNAGAYGASGSSTTATPDTLAGFGPITPSVPFSGTLPDAQPLDVPAPGVGPTAFGHLDVSSGLGQLLNGVYAGALGRSVDQSGLDSFGQAVQSGQMSIGNVYDALRQSGEGQAYTPSSVLNFDPVWNLYGYALGRAPDSAGFQATADALQSGQSYYDVLSNMLTSQEGLQYAGSQGHDGNYVADQLAGLSQAKGAFDLGGISAGGQLVASGGFGGIPAAAWLSPYEVQARSAARSRLMANDAANVANNAYITNQNAFDTAATNNPSLAGVGGSVHGDATGAGAQLNAISQQLANETRAIAAIPAAPTFTPIQTNFYGAQPTANSRNVFAGGLPPGAGFI